jgi:DNA ligase 1
MPSPAKKRKTNKDAPASIGTLDHFFAKQRNGTRIPANTPLDNATGQIDGHKEDSEGEKKSAQLEKDQSAATLTDEEYARKLQEEWNREDAARSAEAAHTPSEAQEPHDSSINDPRKSDVEDDPVKEPTESPSPSKPPTATSAKPNAFLSLQSNAVGEDAVANSIPFDTGPLSFDPNEYVSRLKDSWAAESGGSATYALLTHGFVLVNSTTSRIKIVDTLTNLLRTIIVSDPESLLPAVWLATNSIAPAYEELELGLGGSAISKALKKVCGLDNMGLKTLYNKYGDAGDVAFEAKKRQTFTLRKPKPLTIKSVYQSLVKIATSKGTGSVDNKQKIVEKLVQDARGAEESRYIVRTLVQHVSVFTSVAVA